MYKENNKIIFIKYINFNIKTSNILSINIKVYINLISF